MAIVCGVTGGLIRYSDQDMKRLLVAGIIGWLSSRELSASREGFYSSSCIRRERLLAPISSKGGGLHNASLERSTKRYVIKLSPGMSVLQAHQERQIWHQTAAQFLKPEDDKRRFWAVWCVCVHYGSPYRTRQCFFLGMKLGQVGCADFQCRTPIALEYIGLWPCVCLICESVRV